jgi:hypothetical protein
MMKILMTSPLKENLGFQVDAELAGDDKLRRKQVVLSVLAQFARNGDAERYVRRDGRIGWRATAAFKQALREGRREAEENDDIF